MSLDITLVGVLTVGLRVFGVLYLVAGVWMARQMWFWARIGPDMQRLTRVLDDFNAETGAAPPSREPPEDIGRSWWLFAGACIMAASGLAMALAHRAAAPLLALLIVHQLLYFVRQRRRELKAATAEAEDDARPNRATINGFFALLPVAVLAAWLGAQGALM